MRLAFSVVTLSVALGATHASADQASRWSMSGESLYLWRDTGTNPNINVANPGILPGEIFFKFDDLEQDESWGGRVKIGYTINQNQSVWLRGLYVDGFDGDGFEFMVPSTRDVGTSSSTFSVAPGNNTTTNNTSGGFTAFSYVQETSLWGAELNYQQEITSGEATGVNIFAGPRFLRYKDQLSMVFFEDPDDVLLQDDEIQKVAIDVTNDLYGFQVGAGLAQHLTGQLWFVGSGAVGLYANRVERERVFTEVEAPLTTVVDDTFSETVATWVVDLSAGLSWRIAPNATLDVGYTAMWLRGVSVSANHFERVATIDDDHIRADSNEWIHGVRFGGTIGF